MKLDLQYNYIIFGLVINALALLNLLKNNISLFISLFVISNLIDIYFIDDKYKILKQRVQWFKTITTFTFFVQKYRHDIRFDHKVFFFLILILSSLNKLTNKNTMIFSQQFIVLYIVILVFFIDKDKN